MSENKELLKYFTAGYKAQISTSFQYMFQMFAALCKIDFYIKNKIPNFGV